MSDQDKAERPEAPKAEQKPPEGAGQSNAPALGGPSLSEAMFRATGGQAGTPPLQRIAGERRAATADVVRRMQVMRKAGGAADMRTSVPQTSGVPLSGDVRAKMEPKLGADLSDVRVHTGSESVAAAKGFGARAFTVGNDVHFGGGQFAPGTKEGDKLIAHELTHVVQGQKSGVQRSPVPGEEKKGGEAAVDAEGGATREAKGGADDAKGAQVSQPGEAAEVEAEAVSEKVAGDLHGAKKDDKDEKKAEKNKDKEKKAKQTAAQQKDTKGGVTDAAGGGEEEQAASEGEEKQKPEEKAKEQTAAPIQAKLEGTAFKLWRAPTPPSPPTPPGTPPAAPADPDVPVAQVAQELATAAGAGGNTYTPAEADALAKQIAPGGTVKKSIFDPQKAGCEPKLIKAWRTALGSDKPFCSAYASQDPIAMRKFGELDAEPDTNYEGGGGGAHKAKFYTQLAGVIEPGGTPRKNVYSKCDGAVRGAGLRMLGKIIPESMLQPMLHRTAGVSSTFDYTTNKEAVAADFIAEMRGRLPASLATTPADQMLKKYPGMIKDFWIGKGGAYAKGKLTGNLTPPKGGTWFSSGAVTVKSGDAGFAQLMEIGALQPEWFADGAVKFTINSAGLGAVKENLRKPTCLDGMQSGMFVPRSDPGHFGVTGGGFNEFLAATVPAANVASMEIIATSPGLEAAIRAADAEAKAAGHGSAMDAMERGQTPNLGGAASTYAQVGNRTATERRTPTTMDPRGQRV